MNKIPEGVVFSITVTGDGVVLLKTDDGNVAEKLPILDWSLLSPTEKKARVEAILTLFRKAGVRYGAVVLGQN